MWDQLKELSNEERWKILEAIFVYHSTWEILSMDRMLNIVFISIRSMLDRDRDKYEDYIEKQSENGRKGWRPKKSDANPENPPVILETHWNPTKAKKADSASASVIDSVSAIPSNVVFEEENKQIQDTKTKKKKVYDYSSLENDPEDSFAKEAYLTLKKMWWSESIPLQEFIEYIDAFLVSKDISKQKWDFIKWQLWLKDFLIYWSNDKSTKKPNYLLKMRNSPSFTFNQKQYAKR